MHTIQNFFCQYSTFEDSQTLFIFPKIVLKNRQLFAAAVGAARANFECQQLTTPETYGGGWKEGGLMYLDRQSVNCNDKGVLKQYQLVRGASGGTIYYKYTCCKGSWLQLSGSKTISTSWQENAYDLFTIVRNSISCPDGMGIQGWFLERGNNNNNQPNRFWRYNVSCVPAKSTSCYSKELPKHIAWTITVFQKHIFYLDRHNVDCPNDASFLKSSSIRLSYETCVKGKPECGKLREGLTIENTPFWQYTITCCNAPVDGSEYDYNVVQVVNMRRKLCVEVKTNTKGDVWDTRLGTCGTQNTGMCQDSGCNDISYIANKFYVEPGTAQNQHVLKLHPYLDTGVAMDRVMAEGYNDEVVFKLNASGLVYNSSSNLIHFPESNHKLAASNGNWDPLRVSATSGYDDNYVYQWTLVKQPSPVIVNNLGNVCSTATLSTLKWGKKECPFAQPVVGTGGKKYEATAVVVAPEDLNKMTLVKEVHFYIRNDGSSNALIAAMKFYYNDGDPVWSPASADPTSLPFVSCVLAENEYITKAKIIPQASGPITTRGVQGVIWETNLNNKCKV